MRESQAVSNECGSFSTANIYGESLSVEHWEETCDYYVRHFPFESYGRKWRDHKGRAIHTQSDFMRPLYECGDTLFANAVKI
jgi:hypothetical protein